MSYPNRRSERQAVKASSQSAFLHPALGAAGFLIAFVVCMSGCSLPEPPSQRQAVSCSLVRLDEAQILFLASRSSMVRYYKERNASTLNAAYNFAGDAIGRARATRNCVDFDKSVRAVAVNLIRMSTQMRALAISTMRDPDSQTAVTLLQEQYGEAFAGRDIE